tara:strand:+ start:45 stop:758 length:714 start_codon:yes stop_codon:yes gene_type:complete
MLGDCLERMKKIESGSVDMILADPPYGTTACKWDSVIDFDLMWEQLNRIIKPSGAIVLLGSEPFSSALRMSNIKNYKYDWVWDKVNRFTGALNSSFMPMKSHENLIIFVNKGKPTFNKQLREGMPYTSKQTKGHGSFTEYGNAKGHITINKGGRNPVSIINIKADNKKESGFHPTQKPVALMEYLIKTYTNENEAVLDFTMGSGSTGVAAKNLNRKFIGIEMDEGYFNIAKKRIEEA